MKTRHIAKVAGIGAFASAVAGANVIERGRRPTTIEVDAADDVKAARPIAVLIMAVGRSGSSMVGEFFRQNEDALYFYEPCRKSRGGEERSGLECLALVQRLTQCEFSLEDSEFVASDRNAVSNGSPELTPLAVAYRAERLLPAHEQLLETCNQRRAVAVKSIRLSKGLGGMEYHVPGLNVLHLVRDPRGVVLSQLKHLRTPWVRGSDTDSKGKAYAGGISICDTYRVQLDSSEKLEESRYLLLRYEDVATSPALAVELIYYWSGLGPPPPDVKEWVDTNTRIPDCENGTNRHLRAATPDEQSFGYAYTTLDYPPAGSHAIKSFTRRNKTMFGLVEPGAGEASAVPSRADGSTKGPGGRDGGRQKKSGRNLAVECLNNTQQALQNAQGTQRDSAAMASMWRTEMPEEEARAVWEACEDSGVMAALDYAL